LIELTFSTTLIAPARSVCVLLHKFFLASFAKLEFNCGADGDIKGEHSPPD
jgi:hypothetical protein